MSYYTAGGKPLPPEWERRARQEVVAEVTLFLVGAVLFGALVVFVVAS